MRGVASVQVSAGARTCVLVGPLDDVTEVDLSPYQSVLWFADRQANAPARLGLDRARLVVEPAATLDAERITSLLETFIRRDALHMPSVFLTEGGAEDPTGAFLRVVEAIVAKCETHTRARLTRQQVGFQWQSHLLTNLHAYAHVRVPRTWANALAGVPAFVCGSGPSLDASGDKLREFAGEGVVFAADTALGALARLGVTADFAVTIDATKTPAKCLPADRRPPDRLIAATISPPAWREAMGEGRIFFVSGNQVTEDWLASLGLPKTEMTVQGNCGITAVELAVYLGCAPIYLFGMDNAVDGKGSGRLHQQHFDTKLLGDDRLQAGANYPKVPGNYQDEIATPFLREWRLLDRHCAQLEPGRLHNVIDRGARLSNTTLVHPDEFSLFQNGHDKVTRLAALAPFEAVNDESWRKLVETVHHAAKTGAAAVEEAREAVDRGNVRRAVKRLASAFQNPAFNSLVGSYGLKIMPHLLQPDEGNAELWGSLVGECETLIGLALRLE